MPKKPQNTIVQQLKADFAVVADYFGMSEKDRAAAWSSAVASLSRSAACYRAIAKSLVVAPSTKRKERHVITL